MMKFFEKEDGKFKILADSDELLIGANSHGTGALIGSRDQFNILYELIKANFYFEDE